MIAEMAAYHKSQGSSLWDALKALYKEYGFYKEKLVALTKQGKSGAEEIQAMMAGFRQNPPTSLGGSKVVTIKDYKSDTSTDLGTGEKSKIGLPSSNVLQFFTADGTIVSARPSGTEPKIKFYCQVKDTDHDSDTFAEAMDKLDAKVKRVMADLGVA